MQFSAFLANFKETHKLHPSAIIKEADRITHIFHLSVESLNSNSVQQRPKRRQIADVTMGAPKSANTDFSRDSTTEAKPRRKARAI
jgi:hypothetical protein